MILSDGEIKKALASGELEITGYDPLHIGSCSVDMHLDNKAMVLDSEKMDPVKNPDSQGYLRVDQKTRSADKFTRYDGWEEITIYPGEFYILSSAERFKFSDSIVGFIQGRSSIARMGINIHAAGFFDVGFEGTATLEVTNFTKYPIVIPKHTRICQMVFVPITQVDFEIVADFKTSHRGAGGFGHTGKK